MKIPEIKDGMVSFLCPHSPFPRLVPAEECYIEWPLCVTGNMIVYECKEMCPGVDGCPMRMSQKFGLDMSDGSFSMDKLPELIERLSGLAEHCGIKPYGWEGLRLMGAKKEEKE